ncbi:response regulator receiver domain-containing protein [Maribacter caenipelagi]|jgi:CheY-like chemotaxis protein|uniref:Response regulator receiver domain-containing protein n=1 Tax=Maribacter caenipelagi TaxID=1447781 RepID=A0A4R7D9D5_9FLAO|nr:response regulator [Maribacter caenipelagi]TDS16992.1 response regulator receiver domain-containing protein [Maribacter caenipelagi]|tara:strand:+ start:54 stop:440 length:387 start_codon:yes stop_codon:yes gene_type:complete
MIRILIIEDDEVTNFIAKTNLEKFGYKNITIALNGQLGLDYLQTNTCPDIILLDINMPVLDGWDFLDKVNELNLCSDIPVVITTSSFRDDDKLKADGYHNIIEYLEKPINFQHLNTVLAKLKSKKIEL